jgi:hypothetical protein
MTPNKLMNHAGGFVRWPDKWSYPSCSMTDLILFPFITNSHHSKSTAPQYCSKLVTEGEFLLIINFRF